jgi:hypothetical protein
MDPFLGPEAFAGALLPAAARHEPTVGQAAFNGFWSFTNWPRGDVEGLLPPDIQLASNVSATPHLHPVVFLYGEQTAGALLFGGTTLPTGIRYAELCMAVPFVVRHPRDCLQLFIARMYCAYYPATWNGNVHYGFSKEMATMGWAGPMFVATRADGTLLVEITVDASEPWSQARSLTLPNLASARAVLSLPVLGRKRDGTHVRSYFDWGFDDALVRPADACVNIAASILPGLTPRRCYDVAGGSFEVRGLIWRLSWPLRP